MRYLYETKVQLPSGRCSLMLATEAEDPDLNTRNSSRGRGAKMSIFSEDCMATVPKMPESERRPPATIQSGRISRFDEPANLPFKENHPLKQTAQTLRDELLFQRATQAYLWALQLPNTLGMKFGSKTAFGAGYNVLPIWKKRLDAKTLLTTPTGLVSSAAHC